MSCVTGHAGISITRPGRSRTVGLKIGCRKAASPVHSADIRNSNSCGCGNLGNPLHYATSCLVTISYHLTEPSADLEPLWWKRVMNNNNSREKIRKLIHFIAENETLFFPKDGDNS
ncbi:hypothetical protein AVEN_235099-1 [Araneus ventricosus]|uniref:Uncharacterized protein n=1 Tax=Araneus ventricosus TaxID=182803 RepID=A0A4Y2PMK5_ARAVE|nr:hypothetical protein AVEN_235099-1 [Araneus ventricosus]